MIETINKLKRATKQLVQKTGREPAVEEIARKMKLPVDKVKKILMLPGEPVSFETPIGKEKNSYTGNFI